MWEAFQIIFQLLIFGCILNLVYKKKLVDFQFYFNYCKPKNKITIYQSLLRTGEWQRITMPFEKINFPHSGGITIIADPQSPEYRNGGKVTFEFNGFCVLQKPGSFFKSRIIEKKNTTGELSSITILFFGRPNTQGELRYAFNRPVAFKHMKLLGKLPNGIKPKLKYLKEAQILQVKFTFPGSYYDIPPNLLELMSKKERNLVTERAFLAAGIKLDL